jgi:inhibitor of KinA
MTDLTPLGDQAALANFTDEAAALSFAEAVRADSPVWLVDVVQAYASVAVFFDLDRTRYRDVAAHLRQFTAIGPAATPSGRLHRIPCCYGMQLDLARVAKYCGISADDVIALHTATDYTVYAIGFCPGFPYLGYLPAELCGVPRLEQPRLRVDAGSVGLTGRQTGIYTEARPGGWNIIGRTPLELVNVAEGYFPLRVGDRVRFEIIDKRQFRRLEAKRLE